MHVRPVPLMKSDPGMIKVRHGFCDESHRSSNAFLIIVGALERVREQELP